MYTKHSYIGNKQILIMFFFLNEFLKFNCIYSLKEMERSTEKQSL